MLSNVSATHQTFLLLLFFFLEVRFKVLFKALLTMQACKQSLIALLQIIIGSRFSLICTFDKNIYDTLMQKSLACVLLLHKNVFEKEDCLKVWASSLSIKTHKHLLLTWTEVFSHCVYNSAASSLCSTAFFLSRLTRNCLFFHLRPTRALFF